MSRGIDKRCATRQEPTSELAAKVPVQKGNQVGLPLGLPETARTIQVVDGTAHVKTGPYLTEGVRGYSVLEVENMDAAIEKLLLKKDWD